MLEFKNPIPVVVEDNKNGYAIYVVNSGMLENDVWCVVLCEGGIVRHYTTEQIRIYHNATFEINKNKI
jgi:ATP-dependent RNA circularization protein (DNA/RNA ligase family)